VPIFSAFRALRRVRPREVPPLAPSLRRCRASSTSTRCRDGHRRSSATLDGWPRTPRAVPLLKTKVARRARAEIIRQRLPLTTRLQPIQDARHHDSSCNRRPASARLRRS
jgi:hypothetical protein